MVDITATNPTWISLPDSTHSHSSGVCGTVTSTNGTQELVFVGSSNQGEKLDIFNMESYEWRQGSPIPGVGSSNYQSVALAQHSSGSFFLVGGWDGNFLDKIFKFNHETYEWEELPVPLDSPRDSASPVVVPADFGTCG